MRGVAIDHPLVGGLADVIRCIILKKLKGLLTRWQGKISMQKSLSVSNSNEHVLAFQKKLGRFYEN